MDQINPEEVEGIIKFHFNLERDSLEDLSVKDLFAVRKKLRDLNLIGEDPEGVGFGNISERVERNSFSISASGSGGRAEDFSRKHLCLVEQCDFANNSLKARGMSSPSSESLTHAIVYHTLPQMGGVIHVHLNSAWDSLKNKAITTPENHAYGTQELFMGIKDILLQNFPHENKGFILMGGHYGGLLAFAENLNVAYEELLERVGKFISRGES